MHPIGVLPSFRPSYIDHLVPLCALFGAPILVTEPFIQQLIELYYPEQKVLLAQPQDYNLDPYLEPYDTFLYVDLFRLASDSFWFADYFCRLPRRSLCALHGHSEKAWSLFRFERFADEQTVLLYGPSWEEFLKKIGVWERLKQPLIGGNYRLSYYLKHRSFFDKITRTRLAHLDNQRLLLYAPTWTSENLRSELSCDYSPFLGLLPHLMEKIPSHWHLCLKVHPHFQFLHPEKVEQIQHTYGKQLTLLSDFPLIYPLLERMDAFLGDYSSIGYDALYFDKPLYFFEGETRHRLFQCGEQLTKETLGRVFEEKTCEKNLSKIRQEEYAHAFGSSPLEWADLKETLLEAMA